MSTPTSITLHRPSVDNSGAFRDSGSEITIGTGAAEITAARAREIVEGHGAAGHYAPKPPPAPATSKKVAVKQAPAPSPAPAPAPATSPAKTNQDVV